MLQKVIMPFPKLPPKDFHGLRRDLPVEIYRRNLPHMRQAGGTYFGTFHLNDALPQSAVRVLKAKRDTFNQHHAPPHDNERMIELARQLAAEEERWLDQGHGACPYRSLEQRVQLQNLMHDFDVGNASLKLPARYALNAFVLMPNHVHVLIRPFDVPEGALETTVGRWKQRSSQLLNKQEGRNGARWFQESYDRIVRDSEELWRCLQYIGRNGVRAGLGPDEYTRWVCPEWVQQGWDFDS
jgi:hypothetical protein